MVRIMFLVPFLVEADSFVVVAGPQVVGQDQRFDGLGIGVEINVLDRDDVGKVDVDHGLTLPYISWRCQGTEQSGSSVVHLLRSDACVKGVKQNLDVDVGGVLDLCVPGSEVSGAVVVGHE